MDTIAAIATPLGEGGIGVVRISGPNALSIADSIFKGKTKPSNAKNFTIHYGKIIDPALSKELDEVLLMVMKNPHTYTREDMVEINTHGGVTVLKKVLELVLQNGARLAEPGEFTKRAFLTGRIDLIQAEAVLDVVNARTDKSLEVALSQLDGRLSAQIKSIKDKLVEIETFLELSIDFPEENVGQGFSLAELIQEVSAEIHKLLESGESGRLVRDGAIFPIVGRTNVGKSSLFNAILSEDRAIVTQYPGTTRDTIEGWISVDGIPVRLVDTAGLKNTNNPVEKEGVSRTKKAIEKAFGVLLVFDRSVGVLKEDIEILEYVKGKLERSENPKFSGKVIGVLNKCDLPAAQNIDTNLICENFPLILISALRGDNIDLILSEIGKVVSQSNEPPLATRERHLDALRRININLKRAQNGIKDNLTSELISYEIKEALNVLGELTGEVTSEDILDNIFSEFCIGK